MIRRVASVSVLLLADFFMAQRSDIERGRAIVERWCALAERRLDYLIELQDSGRWRRFHSEPDFQDNLREARAAVESWRMLASREASLDNQPIDFGWLGRDAVPLKQREIVTRADCLTPVVYEAAATTIVAVAAPPVVPDAPEAAQAPVSSDGMVPVLDLAAIEARYPLLRNAL